jgi:hypothetical protein
LRSPRHAALDTDVTKTLNLGKFLLLSFALFGAFLAADAGRAEAHTENSTGFSAVEVGSGEVRYRLSLDYFELGRVVAFDAQPGDQPDVLSSALAANTEELQEYLRSRLQLSVDAVSCDSPEIRGTSVDRLLDRDYAVTDLVYVCPGDDTGDLQIRYNVFFDDNDSLHRNILDYRLSGHAGQFVLTTEAREFRADEGSLFGQVRSFIELGFHHILGGNDHILFVVALLLGANSLFTVLKMATAFTAAHSVTLALTALGWVSVPPEIVEPLIALSIGYVAVENLFGASVRAKLPVVFAFGLLHGMGFAGTLQITGEVEAATLLSLVAFNLGVELGQTLIILAVFPALLLARRFRWTTYAQVPATCLIGVLGYLWFFERLIG